MEKEIKIGKIIEYENSGRHLGQIVAINDNTGYITVIDPENLSSVQLWCAGYNVGACIEKSQILKLL